MSWAHRGSVKLPFAFCVLFTWQLSHHVFFGTNDMLFVLFYMSDKFPNVPTIWGGGGGNCPESRPVIPGGPEKTEQFNTVNFVRTLLCNSLFFSSCLIKHLRLPQGLFFIIYVTIQPQRESERKATLVMIIIHCIDLAKCRSGEIIDGVTWRYKK